MVESFSDIPAYVLLRLNLIAAKSYSNGNGTESCQSSRFGTMFGRSTESRGKAVLTLSPEVSRARTYRKQTRTLTALTVREAAFGERCRESSAKYDPISCSLKTPQCLLFEDSTESWVILPEWGLMRNGECFGETSPECLNAVPVCSLEPITDVPKEYLIKTPSMIRAIERDWMQEANTLPTLTTKIRERAPCPYWKTPIGPRYLTEGEAEALMGWPIGWSGKNALETDKFQLWLSSHGVASHPQTVESNTAPT